MKFLIFLIGILTIGGVSLNVYGESIDEMFNTAEKLIMDKKYVLAIEKYSDILKIEEEDETALLNRAYAFSKIGDYESSLNDFSVVLKNNSENMYAIEGAATILALFDCVSYTDCPPLNGLQLFEDALKRDPTNEDLKMKRDFYLTKIPAFDISETNGDYIVNIQHVTRDKDGRLVSVIQSTGTSILPIKMLDDYLDDKVNDSINFKKEIVEIDAEKYTMWHFEHQLTHSQENRNVYGKTAFEKLITTKSEEGYDVRFNLELLYSIMSAQSVDIGDKSYRIIEVFKKI
tara:strand:- start:19650 stop:20513 length:864 start_codon:yes stop_codon:yes gene_type:complete